MINIGSGTGLVPPGNKSWLPEQILNPLRWRHNGCGSVSNHQPHHFLLNRLFKRRSKKTSKLRVTGLRVGNSPGTGEFPAQMASNAENVSIWWRHHADLCRYMTSINHKAWKRFYFSTEIHCLYIGACYYLNTNFAIQAFGAVSINKFYLIHRIGRRIYASANQVITVCGNVLSCIRCNTITWTSDAYLSLGL